MVNKLPVQLNPSKFPRCFLVIGALFLIVIAAFGVYLALPYPNNYLSVNHQSIKIKDRHGNLMMEISEVNSKNSGFESDLEAAELSRTFGKILLYTEDRHFFEHNGIHLPSIFRAFFQNIKHGKIVSGGSTISQQLIKLKNGYSRNNIFTKSLEIIRALKLELHYSKREILYSYLNHIYLGNHIYGLKKASAVYFQKSPLELSCLEMGAILAILQNPSRLNIYRNTGLVEKRALEILRSACVGGYISSGEYLTAREEHLYPHPFEANVRAPHFSFWALGEARKVLPGNSHISEIITTFDSDLYTNILQIFRNRVSFLEKHSVHDASLVMVDNHTHEILVMLGNLDYFGESGQINASTIRRQAASTMKPFTYALAFEKGLITPATILPDIYTEFPSAIGKYIPHNFSETYHGPVRTAMALGSSYNVPAVYVLQQLGTQAYLDFLRDCGFHSIRKEASFYGLGLTLGNADVSLLELAQAYTIFPAGGNYRALNGIKQVKTTDGRVYRFSNLRQKSVLSKESAYLITHILSDYRYKVPGFGANSPIRFPFPIAVKTGTSKDYRDNFIAAYDQDYTFAIWTGNLSGEVMRELPSSIGSGILLRDVVSFLYNDRNHKFRQNRSMDLALETTKVCTLSGMRPGNDCNSETEYFLSGTSPKEVCSWHRSGKIILPSEYSAWASANLHLFVPDYTKPLRIVHPVDGDIFKIEGNVPIGSQEIGLEVEAEAQLINWYVDGNMLSRGKKVYWRLQKGRHQIRAEAVYSSGKKLVQEVNVIVVE